MKSVWPKSRLQRTHDRAPLSRRPSGGGTGQSEGSATSLSRALRASILNAWSTNNRSMIFLVERLPAALWDASVPGSPRRTIRMLAGHIHNARCMWIKTLGRPHGITVPPSVDRRRVSRRQLIRALKDSGGGIASLLNFGLERGGQIPATRAYVWRNLPLDVGHVLTYFVAHEGHHRGQLVMLARQLGHRLPSEVTNGLWQWTKRSAESKGAVRLRSFL